MPTFSSSSFIPRSGSKSDAPKGDESEQTYLAGFYSAAVTRIGYRLDSAYSRFERESDQTRALIVMTGTDLSTAVRKQFPRLGSWRSSESNAGKDGMRDGSRAGDRVKLTRDAALSGAGGASLRLAAGR